MDAERRDELEVVMAALAADECDQAALNALFDGFHDELAAIIRFEANRRVGRSGRCRPTPDEITGLVWDACEAIAGVARSWRPDGGALPWVWARRRVDQVVAREYPPEHLPLPDEGDLATNRAHDPVLDACLDEPDVGTVLHSAVLASVHRHPSAPLVVEALDTALAPHESALLLRYDMQKRAGDPSPAHTLGVEWGLAPPAVRQRTSRSRRKLQRLVHDEPRFAALADLPLVTGAA